MLVFPQIHMKSAPHPHKVMVIGGGTFGKWLSHKGGALLNGTGPLIKSSPSTRRGHSEKTCLRTTKGTPTSPWILYVSLQNLEK